MKRRTVLALSTALLLLACAGAAVIGGGDGPAYGAYFLEADLSQAAGSGALRAEPVVLGDVSGTREEAETLLLALLRGPSDATLKSPFPPGTQLRALELEGSRALVTCPRPMRPSPVWR